MTIAPRRRRFRSVLFLVGCLLLAGIALVASRNGLWRQPETPSPAAADPSVVTGAARRPDGPPAGPVAPAEDIGEPWFVDVTRDVGLDFVHDPGPIDRQKYFMPQIVGSGVALFDHDGDGRLDVYLINNGGPQGRPNALFKQLPDGTFRDVSGASGLAVAGYGMGVAVADVDNNNAPDVLVTEFGRIRLFVNAGDGRFTPAIDGGLTSALWGTSACFLDYDRDGWLDLAVANYVDYDPAWICSNAAGARDYCHPSVFQGTVTRLFHNVTGRAAGGEGGRTAAVRFEDVTVASGLGRAPGPGLGITSGDFNGDGWPDIFVANDAQANHLWINQQDGTFGEEAKSRGIAYDAVGRSLANMGIALGDVAGRGLCDLFVTHLPEETHTLWRQELPGLFVDQTAATGILNARWRATGFGTVLADFNHDGWLDLAVANGRVVRLANADSADHWPAYAERNQLFAGVGPGKFRDVSTGTPAFCREPNVGRGLAVADLDGDGALDLVLTTAGGRARVLRNVTPRRGHWLLARVVDAPRRRDAYGAEVRVVADGRRFVTWVIPGQSFLTSHDSRVHIGMGAAASFESLEVLWPDGVLERFPGGDTDRELTLRRGEGELIKSTSASTGQ